MVAHDFDRLAKRISSRETRRDSLRVLVALSLGVVLSAPLGPDQTGAERPLDRVRQRAQRRQQRHQTRNNDNDKGSGGSKNGGKSKSKRQKCLPLGATCDRERPWECCSGGCRPAGTEGIPYNHVKWPVGESPVCIDIALGCTRRDHSCDGDQDTSAPFCPNQFAAHCYVTVEGRPICGILGSLGNCRYCESDRDCELGSHCVECNEACALAGTRNRACFFEGIAPQ